MSSIYTQPRLSRQNSWKLAAAGAAALLLVAGVLVLALSGSDAADADAAAAAPAATSPAREAPAATATPAETVTVHAAPAPEPAPAPAATTISIGVVSGAPGVPADAPIRLTGADGLGSASIRLTYDPSVVTVTGIRNGDVPQAALRWHHDEPTGVIVMLLTTSLAEGAVGDHAFAFLTFEARDGAVGETSPLALDVRGGALADGGEATLAGESGSFRNGIAGDVLGDGTVDQADYDRLAGYLVGETSDIVLLNADLDGDGAVTDADAVRLHQYLDGTRDSL